MVRYCVNHPSTPTVTLVLGQPICNVCGANLLRLLEQRYYMPVDTGEPAQQAEKEA